MSKQRVEKEGSQALLNKLLWPQSELEFERLLDMLPAGAYMCDADGLITYYNQRAVEIWARVPKLNDPVDRFCGSFKLLSADGLPLRHDQCWMALAIQNNRVYNGYEIIVEHPDGSRLNVLAYASPIRNGSGKLIGALNVLVDINDRKREEEALFRAYEELEQRVAERTADLAANEEMARRQAARAEALANAARLLNAQLDLKSVLATVCKVMGEALNVAVILVYLFDESSQTFVFADSVGLPAELKSYLRPLPSSLYERYTKELGPVKRFLNLAEVQEWLAPELVDSIRLQRATIVDLDRTGQIIGCIIVLKGEQEHWLTPDELRLLKALADQGAQAITNARLYQEVRAREAELHQLSQRILKAEEEEREHLSRELHDSTGQVATALLINLALLQQQLPDGNDALMAHIVEANELARRIYDEVRAISHGLRPPELEQMGLHSALNELCQEFGRYTRQPVEYEGVAVPPLPDMVAVTFYRFVQEGLNNAAKHAQASRVAVVLQYKAGCLRVTVEDDGVGFTHRGGVNVLGAGVGLLSMSERLGMLGGQLEIHSEPGRGTRLVASYCLSAS
ncbi:MAG: histidine kinase [Chloroflexi bacterium]|nr:histidine kinase [Chloroflexota bacterium]MCI0644094.1 histidine kinase [Chloroflexota bacterium]